MTGVVVAALVARLTEGRRAPAELTPTAPVEPADRDWLARAPGRIGRALTRLAIVLVPEYLVIVFLVGAFRGWLFPIGTATGTGLLVVLPATVVGTLVITPTAGEIPILQGWPSPGSRRARWAPC